MNNQLIKIDEVTSIMGGFDNIVNRSNTSVSKCNEAGQALLDTIEGNGGMNEALDQKAAEYLEKTKTTIKNMGERRKPITQLFDKIRSAFTAQEKSLDPKEPGTIPGQITKLRDKYAREKYEAEQKRKQEAERLAKLNAEKATYKRDLEEKLLTHFNTYLRSKKEELNKMFNALTLAGFDRETNMILLFPTDYPKAHFDAFSGEAPTYFIGGEAKAALRTEVLSGKYEYFASQFKSEITDAKQWCKDRFASKKKELQELEELRQRDTAAAAEVERVKLQREQEEAAKRTQEEASKAEQQRKEIEMKAQQEQMASLFDQSAAMVAPVASNAKVKEKIQVLHPTGFLEIFNMWWLNEGQSQPIDELEKAFKKQITFCEKRANGKEPEYIKSNYVKYVEDVRAK
ncbi:hypothetical protein [Bacteroides sp. 51]|uniref:hypothetical protein n=1 Tax=Bacteroides sp. 51 TaxID=2302938 RepID=UPI0013D8311C|nr:hypothetical protein [Bacteroides sp. 51]NDV81298.1 hypothetical protein [Bacteroides sp. 51]